MVHGWSGHLCRAMLLLDACCKHTRQRHIGEQNSGPCATPLQQWLHHSCSKQGWPTHLPCWRASPVSRDFVGTPHLATAPCWVDNASDCQAVAAEEALLAAVSHAPVLAMHRTSRMPLPLYSNPENAHTGSCCRDVVKQRERQGRALLHAGLHRRRRLPGVHRNRCLAMYPARSVVTTGHCAKNHPTAKALQQAPSCRRKVLRPSVPYASKSFCLAAHEILPVALTPCNTC